MKKIFFTLTGIVSFTLLQAQIKEGTVYFDQKVNMHRAIKDEQVRAMMPEFRTARFILQFSDSTSMYKAVPEDEAPDPFANGGARFITRTSTAATGLYKNVAQSKSIETREVGGKNFLVIDTMKQQAWKLGTETKKILGYNCHKATRKIMQASAGMGRTVISGGNASVTPGTSSTPGAQGIEVEIVAWYAEELISPVGPDNYGQLPGVILQLDIDNGATVFTATEVKKTVDPAELKEPGKGKIVTRQEYIKMMVDMMGNMQTGGGNGVIRF